MRETKGMSQFSSSGSFSSSSLLRNPKMKPHEFKLPFIVRPPYIFQSIPKLIILSALVLLTLNLLPPFRFPLLQLYNISSSSPCNVSIILNVSPSSSLVQTSDSPSSSPSSPSSIVSETPIIAPSSSQMQNNTSSSSLSLAGEPLTVASTYSIVSSPPPAPSPPPPLPSPPPPSPHQSIISESPKNIIPTKKCDISRGEWVRDEEAPLYTNTTCSAIQEHQNCMRFGRPDTDFLKWRWRPQGCELPRFDPIRFLELVRGKSMAFVGDSLARNHMQSLLCLLSKVEYPKDITDTPTFKSMIYTNYNFTISIFWSPFLVKSEELKNQGYTFWNLYLDEVDKKWASKMSQFNYVIISGGNWYNRPSIYYRKRKRIGCLYCEANDIEHLTMQYANRMAFKTALRAIVNKRAGFKGTVFLRALSPSHFEGGEWDKGGNCARTGPYRRNEARMEAKERELYKAQLDEFKRVEREGKKRGVEFKVLDTTSAMLLRPDGHPSKYGHWPDEKVVLYNDCVHWCLPGPVDTWNDFLFHGLS